MKLMLKLKGSQGVDAPRVPTRPSRKIVLRTQNGEYTKLGGGKWQDGLKFF